MATSAASRRYGSRQFAGGAGRLEGSGCCLRSSKVASRAWRRDAASSRSDPAMRRMSTRSFGRCRAPSRRTSACRRAPSLRCAEEAAGRGRGRVRSRRKRVGRTSRSRPASTSSCRRTRCQRRTDRRPGGEVRGDVEPNRPKIGGVVERVGSPDGEREEVVERELLGGCEILDRGLLVVRATEIHVSGGPLRRVEAEVECEGAFEDPAIWGNGYEPTEEELERDPLPEAGETEPSLRGLGLEAVVESLAKRGCGRVSHRSGNSVSRTRVLPRRAASCSSCRCVTRPRPTACRAAIAACSG